MPICGKLDRGQRAWPLGAWKVCVEQPDLALRLPGSLEEIRRRESSVDTRVRRAGQSNLAQHSEDGDREGRGDAYLRGRERDPPMCALYKDRRSRRLQRRRSKPLGELAH